MSWFDDEKKRVPIPAGVKKEVYKRAGGKCENPKCLIKNHKMKMNDGHFHHTRAPHIKPTAKTVQFLCPNCHNWHAHERKTKTESGLFYDAKKVIVKRKKVGETKPKKKTPTTPQYVCKLNASDRSYQCNKRKATKACLTIGLFDNRCEYLRVSRKKLKIK